MPGNIIGDPPKLDDQATLGLAGTSNSLAYRVHEIEKHFHSDTFIFGLANAPNAEIHRADRIILKPAPFVLTNGNDDWGAWVQLFGSGDTPVLTNYKKFDFNKFQVASYSNNQSMHFVQIACGESADLAAAVTNNEITELEFLSGVGATSSPAINFTGRRIAAGCKVWARLWVRGKNGGTLSNYMSTHEYIG